MANEIVLPSPVSAFLQGRQMVQGERDARQMNQLRQMQILQAQDAQQRDVQFRQALPAYLTGGTNALAALYAADPERAMQAQQFAQSQNALEQQKKIEQAKVAHAQATGVLNSAAPARYMRVLLPQIAAQWAQQNGVSPEQMTDEDARALASEVATMAGAAAGIVEKPIEVAAGASLVTPDRKGGFSSVFTAPSKDGDGFTLGEGQTRFDASGKPVASVAKASDAPKAEKPEDKAKRLFEMANTLRDEYDTQSKDFQTATQAYQRVLSSVQNPSAAGDLALIFSYMRTLDPGSSVREGEFANAENAGGIPAKIRSQYNKVLTGERLAPEQRADFVQKAGELYQGQKQIDVKRREKYAKLATRAQIDPIDVLGDEVTIDVPVAALAPGQSTTTNGFKVTRKK